jgi:hypothetical protein
MFDETLKRLRQLNEGVKVSIDMPLDEDGYFDRRCPGEQCGADFKVLYEDWREKVSDAVVYCPLCRGEAEATEWPTPEQQRYIADFARAYIAGEVGQYLRQDAEAFNRRQPRSGFIRMSMSFRPGSSTFVIPADVAAQMRQKFTCEQCGCRYASIGAAFFCPACGHNSADTAFDLSIETVRKLIGSLPGVRTVITQSQDSDTAQNTVRQLLEDSVGRLVASFQRIMEVLFNRLPQAQQIPQRRSVFQNLIESSALWRKAGCDGYEDMLDAEEMTDLARLFQQRHVLQHKDGIVDADYIAKSGDPIYSVGQRIVVSEGMVLRLADLVEKLAARVRLEALSKGG